MIRRQLCLARARRPKDHPYGRRPVTALVQLREQIRPGQEAERVVRYRTCYGLLARGWRVTRLALGRGLLIRVVKSPVIRHDPLRFSRRQATPARFPAL